MADLKCPLGEDCDLTIAYMLGAEKAKDTIKALRSALAAREAECERLRIFIGDAKEAIDADDVIAAYHILATALTATPAPQHDALTPVQGGEA